MHADFVVAFKGEKKGVNLKTSLENCVSKKLALFYHKEVKRRHFSFHKQNFIQQFCRQYNLYFTLYYCDELPPFQFRKLCKKKLVGKQKNNIVNESKLIPESAEKKKILSKLKSLYLKLSALLLSMSIILHQNQKNNTSL